MIVVTVTVVAVVVVVVVLILMLVLLLLLLLLPLLLIARLRLHEEHDVARTAGLLGLDVGCVRYWVICSSAQIRSDQIDSGRSFVRPQWCPWGASLFFFFCVLSFFSFLLVRSSL